MPRKHMPMMDANFSTMDVAGDANRRAAAARAQAELIEILARLVLANVEAGVADTCNTIPSAAHERKPRRRAASPA